MPDVLNEITQISIYIKEAAERVNEVALFHPLLSRSAFDQESKPIAARKFRYTKDIPFFKRVVLKVQGFIFKHLAHLIPPERLTAEAKFKTVLALLLAQESVRDYFLRKPERRETFLASLKEAASACHYPEFNIIDISQQEDSPLKISHLLTTLDGKKVSLIEDLADLNLQMSTLKHTERSEILFRILNQVERPPITSVLEITKNDTIHSVPVTTQYAKYKVNGYDSLSGKISYNFEANRATSSIKTLKNTLPNAKGAMNQRILFDAETSLWIGSCCGELSTPFHVLEQILFLLESKGVEARVLSQVPTGVDLKRKRIVFTSLYSWHEMSLIADQRAAVREWDQKVLQSGKEYYFLDLLYYNIPFNALNKYPSPAEIKAKIEDVNDEALITLLHEAWEKLGLQCEKLTELAHQIRVIRQMDDMAFVEREKKLLETIDKFRVIRSKLIAQLEDRPSDFFLLALLSLLSQKKPNGKVLKGIDKLIYFDAVANQLGYLHNKNCQNATDRTAGADAADKAQHTFQKIYKKRYLPGNENPAEKNLFKVLYSMYLVWEEPEINSALSTGFTGEKFYNNFLQKNPETTRYLVWWLKKHPEMYLGLSDYRS